ncbi:profilin I [Dictyostelium discoideum AX4]|uniref:Profilin-1 n=1 Tax=Dictyostelium discoideum TaxID=44689 RepID=PROF1_DICDI|nr:profilin I [Dictyostelium discoideum AX4]P26199.1 RecName: Full=Profilin-1; AltName: Full=Profilin I [Dictyostelium discoideum]EAL63837.1 profilin I [Dictyostelium discoideum AX4]CAA43781.1 profilin I [Dictyostelium discoideum]|eukprot:XP_637371.1 profilin I [Dictyostelium discoideum AX4]
MSWQQYVDEQLTGAGLSQGAILGANDGGVWAKSSGINITKPEGDGIAALFKNPAEVFAKGALIGGVKYMGIKGDPQSIYGKKGATGCVLVRTGQAIIVGIYDDKVQPGSAALIVEKLGDYLRDNGY